MNYFEILVAFLHTSNARLLTRSALSCRNDPSELSTNYLITQFQKAIPIFTFDYGRCILDLKTFSHKENFVYPTTRYSCYTINRN